MASLTLAFFVGLFATSTMYGIHQTLVWPYPLLRRHGTGVLRAARIVVLPDTNDEWKETILGYVLLPVFGLYWLVLLLQGRDTVLRAAHLIGMAEGLAAADLYPVEAEVLRAAGEALNGELEVGPPEP